MCVPHRMAKEDHGVPHHNLAKPELLTGVLGPCPSWDAVSGPGQGPCSSPCWDQVVAAQACWAGD